MVARRQGSLKRMFGLSTELTTKVKLANVKRFECLKSEALTLRQSEPKCGMTCMRELVTRDIAVDDRSHKTKTKQR